MSENTAKIRLKIGRLEVEYEGKESFLQDGLFNLTEKLVGSYAEHQSAFPIDSSSTDTQSGSATNANREIDMSTNTIASRLGTTTGTDLVMAACTYLTLVQNMSSFSRQEILQQMKGATNYYKKNMASNLTKMLLQLVRDGLLLQGSGGNYALTAQEKHKAEKALDEHL